MTPHRNARDSNTQNQIGGDSVGKVLPGDISVSLFSHIRDTTYRENNINEEPEKDEESETGKCNCR